MQCLVCFSKIHEQESKMSKKTDQKSKTENRLPANPKQQVLLAHELPAEVIADLNTPCDDPETLALNDLRDEDELGPEPGLYGPIWTPAQLESMIPRPGKYLTMEEQEARQKLLIEAAKQRYREAQKNQNGETNAEAADGQTKGDHPGGF
jgi:hypothetical protein